MDLSELFKYLINVFENLGIRYFITGSMASMFYGEPRFTNDIDDVVIPKGDDFNKNRFSRIKRVSPVEGSNANMASPEDVIIMKMRYYKEGGSEKHRLSSSQMLFVILKSIFY